MSPALPASQADPAPLAQPLHLAFSGKTARNRFLKAAMSEHMATWDPEVRSRRGIPTTELVNLYRRWGQGGFGVILTGNVVIDYDNLETYGNPIVPLDAPFEGERFDKFREMAAAGKAGGGLMIAQVSHPGRQVSEDINPHPIAPSDIPLDDGLMGKKWARPKAMDEGDFKAVLDGFVHAAEFLYKAGFDGVQLHAGHGYLLSQFLSPSTNKRTDQYGGSLENRSRFIFEIASAIRARVPDPSFSLSVKINSVEFEADGISLDDCRDLCRRLEANRFDFVELSGGTYQQVAFVYQRESTRRREAFFLEFADAIIPELKTTKTYVTGGLRTVGAMVEALKTVDGVGLGRPSTHDFDLPQKIIDGRVQGAKQTLIGEDNYIVGLVAAGAQIRLVGEDKQPLDLSRQDHLNTLMTSLGAWQGEMGEDIERKMVGWCDMRGFETAPYGTEYVAA